MKNLECRALTRALMLSGCLGLVACGGSSGGGVDAPGGATNKDPTADAGKPQTVDAGTVAVIEGAGSDPDGTVSAFAWKQTDGPTVTVDDADTDTASFEAPGVDSGTELTFELTVTDNDGASATDTVVVTVAPVIAMKGRVYDGPLANATLTVTVGEKTYTTTADADGNYELNIGAVDPDAFITITATGGEGQEEVELLSYAASFGTLQDAAGEDGTLEDGESGAVNVTNVSTAKAVLMIESNGGEAITSEEQASDAEKNVNGDEMLRLATVIKLVVDGGFSLPEGVKSTLDLVDDTATAEAFITEVNNQDATAFETMQETMLSDPELFEGFGADDVPVAYNLLLVNTLKAYGVSEYMYGARGPRYEFNQDGTGQLYSSSVGGSGGFSWSVVDGEIAMTFSAPLETTGWCWVDGYVSQIRCNSSVTQKSMRLVSDGVLSDQLRVRSIGTRSYPDNGELADEAIDDYGNWVALSEAAEIPFSGSEFDVSWAFNVAGPDTTGLGDDALASGILEFAADGTGSTAGLGPASPLGFDWSVSEKGRLVVNFDDGSSLRVRRLREDGIAYDAQMEFETAAGDIFTDAGLASPQGADFVDGVTAAEATGFYTLFGQHPYFSIVLQSSGSAIHRGYEGPDVPIAWTQPADGSVVMGYRYDIDGGVDVESCDGLTNCHLWKTRTWVPVAYDETKDRLIAYERQETYDYTGGGGENQGAVNWVQSSLRFWGRSDTSLDDDGVLSKPSAPVTTVQPYAKAPFTVYRIGE